MDKIKGNRNFYNKYTLKGEVMHEPFNPPLLFYSILFYANQVPSDTYYFFLFNTINLLSIST